MALPVTYDFAGAGPNIAANFTAATGMTGNPFIITSGIGEPQSVGSDAAMYENVETYPNDQYSQLQIITLTGGSASGGEGVGVAVRMSTSAREYYLAVMNAAASNNVELSKFVAGSYTFIARATAAFVTTQLLRLEVSGTALTVKYNGVTLISTTDASIATGKAGFGYSSSVSAATVDSWEAGAASAAPPALTGPFLSQRPSTLLRM